MKVIAILAALLAVATAQFSCDNCDNAGARRERTGCRLFCRFSEGRDIVVRDDLKRVYFADRDTDEGVTRGRWVERQIENVGYCEDEANRSFDLISGLGSGPEDLIDETDIDALGDLFEELSGTTELTKESYLTIYSVIYALIGNDACGSGF